MSAEERTNERRERLLEAGLDLFAANGYAAASVKEITRAAGLTERYFYESFANREDLLRAVADRIVSDFLTAVEPLLPLALDDLSSAVPKAAEAFVASLADDPRRARVLLVETVGVSGEAEDYRRAVIGDLARFLREAGAQAFGDWVREAPESELIARSLIGAAQELLVAYVRGELDMTRDELISHLATLFLTASPVLSALAARRSA